MPTKRKKSDGQPETPDLEAIGDEILDAAIENAGPALPDGQPVMYVLPDTTLAPAVLVDVGGVAPRIVVQTDSGLQEYSLIQYIGGTQAPTFSANQEPGTWHWPAQGE